MCEVAVYFLFLGRESWMSHSLNHDKKSVMIGRIFKNFYSLSNAELHSRRYGLFWVCHYPSCPSISNAPVVWLPKLKFKSWTDFNQPIATVVAYRDIKLSRAAMEILTTCFADKWPIGIGSDIINVYLQDLIQIWSNS